MKNKVFSGALFAENLKRYIGLIIAGFLIMFVSAPFELLNQTKNPSYHWSFVDNMLSDQNAGFLLVQIALPVCAAVVVFQYLYKVNSTSLVHAMPFSRTKLYVSNYISGLVIAMIPQILNWVLMLALKRPTYAGSTVNYVYDKPVVTDPGAWDLYTFSACCEWLLMAFIIVFFTYSIAVFACMVSGNSVIAILTGVAFNFVAAALLTIFLGYVVTNCFGVGESAIIDAAAKTHPVFMVVSKTISVKNILIFALIAVVIAVAGRYVYYLRKLERCGDSYVFTIMQDIIGFLFVLGASSATGLLLFEGIGFSAYLIGGLIGFVIGQMITRKTFRLWNKKTLKNLIIFFVLMALIICCFVFDVFGIEKRVPDADRVKTVEYSDGFLPYDGHYEIVTSDNPEVIKTITQLHGDIVSNLDYIKDELISNHFGHTESFGIKYYLHNGTIVERDYNIPVDLLADNENVIKLLEISGYKDSIKNIRNLGAENLETHIAFNYFGRDSYEEDYSAEQPQLTDVQKQALLEALADDMDNSFITDRLAGMNDLFFIRMEKTYTDAELKKLGTDSENAYTYFEKFPGFDGYYSTDFGNEHVVQFIFSVNSMHKNTIRLTEQIFGRSLQDILLPKGCIAIIGGTGDYLYKSLGSYQDSDGYFRNLPEEGNDFLTIADADTIFSILLTGSGSYDGRVLWMSILRNDSNIGTAAYSEAYTAWIYADAIPEMYKDKVESIIRYEEAYASSR